MRVTTAKAKPHLSDRPGETCFFQEHDAGVAFGLLLLLLLVVCCPLFNLQKVEYAYLSSWPSCVMRGYVTRHTGSCWALGDRMRWGFFFAWLRMVIR